MRARELQITSKAQKSAREPPKSARENAQKSARERLLLPVNFVQKVPVNVKMCA